MKQRILFLVFLFISFHSVVVAQIARNATDGATAVTPASISSMAPVAPPVTNSTGHDYFGFDLGLTGSAYVGNQNFFWPVTLPDYNNAPSILPFDNLGSGTGGLVGVKAGFPLSSALDLEGKIRYHTNFTTNEEMHDLPSDIAYNSFGTTPQGTSNYSLLLNYLDFDALLHLAFGDRWYGIGGLGFSSLLSNTFSATQTLASDPWQSIQSCSRSTKRFEFFYFVEIRRATRSRYGIPAWHGGYDARCRIFAQYSFHRVDAVRSAKLDRFRGCFLQSSYRLLSKTVVCLAHDWHSLPLWK
jgi:hypothetical protein